MRSGGKIIQIYIKEVISFRTPVIINMAVASSRRLLLTHPYSIYIWQPSKPSGGAWIEPVQVYTQEYALYVANLIHQDSRSVIKVVRYGLNIACFPDAKTVERVEQYIAKHQEKPL